MIFNGERKIRLLLNKALSCACDDFLLLEVGLFLVYSILVPNNVKFRFLNNSLASELARKEISNISALWEMSCSIY